MCVRKLTQFLWNKIMFCCSLDATSKSVAFRGVTLRNCVNFDTLPLCKRAEIPGPPRQCYDRRSLCMFASGANVVWDLSVDGFCIP